MKKHLYTHTLTILFTVISLLLFTQCTKSSKEPKNKEMNSSNRNEQKTRITPRKENIKDNYFGTIVSDPYRWMEDQTSTELKQWIDYQNTQTNSYLAQIPFRDKLKARINELWNYERYSLPFKEADKYYFFKNDGLQNQSVLYAQNTLEDPPKLVFDPNKLGKDGTKALAIYSFSKDGKYFAYGVADGGSDWRTIYVKNIETGEQLKDVIQWVKFSGVKWLGDGFFYSRFPTPEHGQELSKKNEFHQIYYHKLGTEQSADQLVFSDNQHPLRNFSATTTEDERFLIISASESTHGNSLYYRNLKEDTQEITPLIIDFQHEYAVLDNIEDKLLIHTNYKAPNWRLVLVDPTKPEDQYWKTVIPEDNNVLEGVYRIGDKIIGRYVQNATSLIKVFSTSGQYEHDIKLPGLGTVEGIRGKKGDAQLFYSFTSFTYPRTVFKYNLETKENSIFKAPKVAFEPEAYTTEQVWYESKDGTKIPMFLTYKKGLKKDGTNPTILYGYGGFNINILPKFSIKHTVFFENGGIYAVANLRGGGEFGDEWYKNGTLLKKQNVFDDFISAAEYLIEQNYTQSSKLAISGRSNGGLLVGACMTQRPELFKVALPAVGVMDMLRYHKFTIGWAWATDYGTSEDSIHFNNLYGYSPLHNIKPNVNYPATLITTAERDDRVVPAHSFKFAATLQEHNNGKAPALIRIETRAGHGAGTPTAMLVQETADVLGFVFFNLDETL